MTPERAAYLKAYYATPRGKEVRKAALKRHNATPKARERRAEYQRTGKGRAASKKYTASYRGVLRAIIKRASGRHSERWPDAPYILTLTDLVEMWRRQDGLCALTGLKMTWGQGRIRPTSMSLDRVNSERGYTLDNVRLICHSVNAFRGDGTDAEMLTIARALVAFADNKRG